MTVIAMTREMGTRGKEVASLLAQSLASKLVYHELVEDLPGDAEGTSEVRRHLHGEAGGEAQPNGTERRKARLTPAELLALASKGNVIIRGWGAVRLLRAAPQVLCLRVCAPMELRVAEMMRRLGVSRRAARQEIERNDRAHSSLMERFFGEDWRDSLHYDMVLNTAHLSPADCAEIVLGAVSGGTFGETDDSRRALADRAMEARLAALLATDPALRRNSGNVYISVEGGAATLYGAVRNAGMAREIAGAVGHAPGIQSVSNMIEVTGAQLY